MLTRRTLLASTTALAACAELPSLTSPGPLKPAPELAGLAPSAPREFRAAWVATVANIDWPSRKGLSAAEQQAEMRVLLDQAVALKLNAIIFQIRTSADAFYESRLEPWSEYLSGTQGVSPGYDPLALWIAEAHQRGLELHAWFNPFRARQSNARSEQASSHLSRTQPDWVKRYGDQLWIDPGEPAAAAHTLAVFKDVLQRYAVDGIHIDDYFYPYPITDPASKQEIDFPDEPAWQRYTADGGRLARHEWRRQNVDQLVLHIYQTVRETRPGVRFGVSPFGLGKPALRPEGIVGFSQYDKLYADVERWLAEGWLDYLVPQLYWQRQPRAQAFGPLLDYWHGQNPKGRHVWPGLYTSRINDKPESWPIEEIVGQIALQRERAPSTGHAHFSMIALKENRRGIADALKAGPYAQAALVPVCPWLTQAGATAPTLPNATLDTASGILRLGGTGTRHAVWLRYGQRWEFRLAGPVLQLETAGLNGLVVAALDQAGAEGPRLGFSLG